MGVAAKRSIEERQPVDMGELGLYSVGPTASNGGAAADEGGTAEINCRCRRAMGAEARWQSKRPDETLFVAGNRSSLKRTQCDPQIREDGDGGVAAVPLSDVGDGPTPGERCASREDSQKLQGVVRHRDHVAPRCIGRGASHPPTLEGLPPPAQHDGLRHLPYRGMPATCFQYITHQRRFAVIACSPRPCYSKSRYETTFNPGIGRSRKSRSCVSRGIRS